MCAALTEHCLGSVSDGFLVLAGPTACGRWLVSASGSFLEPQLELHVPRGSANLRSIPTTVARNSTRR